DGRRPHLPSRPRLRAIGGPAPGARRAHRAHRRPAGARARRDRTGTGGRACAGRRGAVHRSRAMITLALSKGRIFDDTAPLLEAAGIPPKVAVNGSRKLILPTTDPELRLIIVRASDVPTYVQYGAADLGVAGKDVLLEHGGEGLYQPVDLGIARCRLSVATREGFDYA